MKIKIAYGVDMRLWRQKEKDHEPSYQDLLAYIRQTFQFDDTKQFRITFKDDDDTKTTIASDDDFKDAITFTKKAEKKSLKLYITDSVQKHSQIQDDEKKESVPIKSNISGSNNNENDKNAVPPSPEQINAFLSDDFVMDLLSDLFVSVFEALQSSNFEISFIECVQGVILSENQKYQKITSDPIWPYFMNEILSKIDHFAMPFMMKMMKMNGTINTEMIKQWVPMILNWMKQRAQNGDNCQFAANPWFGGNCNGFGRRGRGKRGTGRGWRRNNRGRGWRPYHHHRGHHGHHHRGHNGHHHGHNGWKGHRGHHNGYNPWFQVPQNQDNREEGGFQGYTPSAPPAAMGNNQNEDDQIEQEAFEYTEELVSIMNMGFTNINKIKKLLNEHKGNKQNVVQELVLEK